ncbi:MAG TPA: FAD-dependent oxidoreductase, partial [Sphingomonas sp.]|nr:FAD-dependent oxidoreductase [Sphingomonas sp.]
MQAGGSSDAIVIGAGHNGLVCAFYLARAGLKVRMFERRGVVGGAAVTEEFHPGFRNSTASYTVSLLQPRVIADMKLRERGLRILDRPVSNFLPRPDGRYLIVGGGLARTQAEFAKFSSHDAEALPAYYAMLEGVADVLRDLALRTPPNAGGGLHALLAAAAQGRRLTKLGLPRQRDLLDLFTKSARD